MFKRPGVPFFTPLGVGLFFVGLIVGGVIMYAITDFEAIFFATKIGGMIGLAMMVIRWRIAEELLIKERKAAGKDPFEK